MSKLSDLNTSYIQPTAPKQEESGNFTRGFKKAMVQIPETIGGTIGLTGDILGADGMRDYGMGIYEKNKKIEEGLTRDSDSISNVMEGNGSAGDWLASGAGYVGGQALTAIATGGVGGLIGKQIAKRGIAHVIERGAESQIAKQVAENAMSKGVKYGAGAAALGSNLTQEAGSIYPEALAQAQEAGRTLDGWDKARIVGSALAAAGVDTAMEGIALNKVLGGGRRVVKDAAGNAVNESALRAMAREIPAGMAREGVTEGVQTGIERFGAGQDVASKDAAKDYVDSIALGALGGGMGGAGASFSKQRLPETGALSKAANAGIDAENTLRLENRPDPLVSFRDGTVGRQSEVDAMIAALPENERMPARAKLLGFPPQPSGAIEITEPVNEVTIKRRPSLYDGVADSDLRNKLNDVGTKLESNPTDRMLLFAKSTLEAEVVAREKESPVPGNQSLTADNWQLQDEDNWQLRANAEPKIAVPAPTGSFSQVDQTANQIQQEKQQAIANDDAELRAMQDEQDRAQAAQQQEALDAQIADTDARVQAGDAKAIEGRRTELLDGILSSKIVDGLSAKEISALYQGDLADSGVVNSFVLPHEVEKIQRFDDARAAVLEDSQKADEPIVQARATPNEMPELVRERKELSGPVDGTNFKSVDDAIAAGKTLQVVGGKNVLRKGTGAVFKLNTAQHEYYLSKVPKVAPAVKEAASAQVLNKSGKPFAEKFAAQRKQKELGNVHDIVPVGGGYALQAKGEAQVQVKSEQGASVVAEQAPEVKVSAPIVATDVQPSDIQNKLGKPFTTKIGAITAQKVNGGTVTAVDGGYVVRLDAKPAKKKTGGDTSRARLKKENPFMSFLATHGVSIQDRSDVGGEKGKARLIPGHGPLFRKKGLRLDELAIMANEEGFLNDAQINDENDNGGVNALSEMINRALGNEIVALESNDPTANADNAMLEEARAIGIDTAGKTADQVYDDIKAHYDLADESRQDDEYRRAQELLNDWSNEEFEARNEKSLDELINELKDLENVENSKSLTEKSEAPTGRAGSVEETITKQEGGTNRGTSEEAFSLSGESVGEATARVNQQEQSDKEAKAEKARGDDADRQQRIKKEIDLRQNSSSEYFQLGQSAEDGLSGQGDIFGNSVEQKKDDSQAAPVKNQDENDKNSITFERANAKGEVIAETINRGDFVSIPSISRKGEVEGISHANREVKISGQWHDIGTVYHAEKPAEIKPKTTPLSSVIDKVNSKQGNDLTEEDRIPGGDIKSSDNKPESPPVFSRTQKNYMFGIPNEILEEEVAAISKNWKNAPKINIVEYANELPFKAPSDSRGAHHNGQVYLVASNIGSKEEAQMVLFHEVLGHAGLRGALGEELAPALRAIGIQNRSIAEAAAKWRKKNADIRGNKTEDQFLTLSIEEVLSNMAGTGREIKALGKLLAVIQKVLRAIGLDSVANWMEGASNAEALSLLTTARKYIQAGEDTHVFSGGYAQALSRSKDGANFSRDESVQKYRADNEFVDRWTNDLGQPIFYGKKYDLSPIKEFDTTSDFEENSLQLGQSHAVKSGNKVFGFAIKDANGKLVGNAILQVDKSGDIVAIHDIEASTKNTGIGTEVVRNIVASSDKTVAVIQIVPGAQKFWNEVGIYGQDQYDNASVDFGTFTQSIRGRAGRASQEVASNGQGRSGNSSGNEAQERGNERAGDQVGDALFSRSGKGSFADAHDILRSASTLGEATGTVKSLLESNSKFNIWDRTVGTQFGKGKKDADFKKVFDASQQQIDDVAHFSIEAERLAPSILRRLDSIKDNVKAVFSNDTDHKANLKAVSQALFDNIEGKQGVQQKVFSNGELRKQFGLNDKQIEMYREARLSVDTSLERLSQSIIASMGQSKGMDITGLKNASMSDTAKAVQDHLGTGDAHDKIDELLTFTRELQSKGYMPAMRFGEYTVLVTDPKTKKVVYFGMHENAIAANIDFMKAKKDFPGMSVEKGRLNKDAFAMFKGVSPETVELFAKFTGADQNAAFQEYIALAKAGRSSMKRMLERQGIAGFSKDIDRVMASFITSNARQTALNANAYLVTEALSSESLAKKGDVQREAQKLVEYLANPQEEAQKLRGFLFLHFIGGSLASAAVNLTQPILQTTPFLSQYAGSKTVGIMAAAAKMAATGTIENKELAAAMVRAKADGITDPHEIHNLMADASGSTLGSSVKARAVTKLWGSFFSASEAYNRRLTFLAGYQTAQGMSKAELMKAGFDNAYDFAKNSIIETQGLYSKANRPNWARGAVGATLFTFKQFSISYVEFLNRLPRQQKMLALGILVAAAGLQGLPFAEDIEDLIDTIGQSLGHNTNSKKALRNTAKEYLGETLGNILTNGLSTQAGADLQGRLGMGNLLPGTAAFKPSETDKTRDAWEMAGAIGGIIQAFQKSIGKVQQGDIFGMQGALAQMAPGAVKNALKASEMAESGYYKDGRGRNVEKVDLVDSALKAIGLQPQHIAEGSRRRGALVQDSNMVKSVQSSIADGWAHAIAENDQEGIVAARKEMQDWNEINPDSRVKMDMASIRRRVIEIRRTAAERMIKSTPKLLRAGAREELM
jgi:hypothetical protein